MAFISLGLGTREEVTDGLPGVRRGGHDWRGSVGRGKGLGFP
jgi:hypothetical protein